MRKYNKAMVLGLTVTCIVALSACGEMDAPASEACEEVNEPSETADLDDEQEDQDNQGTTVIDDGESEDSDNEAGETVDESEGTNDESEGTDDESEGTNDEGEGTDDEGEGTDDESEGADNESEGTDDGGDSDGEAVSDSDSNNDAGSTPGDMELSNPTGAPQLAWSIGHGFTEDTEGHPHHAIETREGGFAVIGETSVETSQGERYTMYLLLTDASGNVVFKKDLGYGAWSNGNHVLQLPDGHFLVAGSHDISNVTNADDPGQDHERVILKVDGTTGDTLQTVYFPAPGRDAIRGLHLNDDGTVIAVGYKGGAYDDETFVVTSATGFMMKLSTTFDILWEVEAGDFFELRKVVKTKDGQGYAAVGNIAPEGSEFVNFGMYFTNGLGTGNTGPAGESFAYGAGDVYDMDIDSDGHYILGGHTVPLNPDGSDGPGGWEGTAIKVNSSSKSMMWMKTFGNPNNGPNPSVIFDECYGVRAVPWGGYALACGTGIEPPYTNADDPFNVWRAYVARLDLDGNVLWARTYSTGEIDDAAEYLVATRDCGFAVFTDSANLGGYGIYRTEAEPGVTCALSP